MIFVIPIIIGAVAAGFGALGIAKGAEGFNNIKKAMYFDFLDGKRNGKKRRLHNFCKFHNLFCRHSY